MMPSKRADERVGRSGAFFVGGVDSVDVSAAMARSTDVTERASHFCTYFRKPESTSQGTQL